MAGIIRIGRGAKAWVTSGSSVTWSVDAGTQSDRVLFAYGFDTGTKTMTSAAYNGTTMNSMTIETQATYTGGNISSVAVLLSPASGSNNLVYNFSGSIAGDVFYGAYYNVDSTNFPASNISKGTGRNSSTARVTSTVTTTADNCWLITFAYFIIGTSGEENGQDRLEDVAQVGISDTNGVAGDGSTGSKSMSWYNGGSSFQFGSYITLAMAPTGGAPTIYTREAKTSLPTVATDLATTYSAGDVTDVGTDNAVRVGITSVLGSTHNIHLYKFLATANTKGITVTWNGQTTLAPSAATVYLQIWNNNSSAWETLASGSSSSVNTDFTLTGSIKVNNSYYYDGSLYVYARVYQATP